MKNHGGRRNLRGGALASSMLFMVLIAFAGAALLSVSLIHQVEMVRAGIDVRLLVAAEAALESKRGQFVLIYGVQDDWSGLMPAAGWNNIGAPVVVNGIPVQVQAHAIGDASTLQARLRGIATASQKTRVVEYTVKAASFADYALYFGATDSVNIGANFKMVGNYYSRGSIDLANKVGIEFFNRVETSEKVLAAPDPTYNFKQGYTDYAPVVDIPPSVYGLDPMRAAAAASGTLFYANTISIELVNQKFRRTYEYRYKGTGTNYTQNDYTTVTDELEIPDNSVIYVDSSQPPTGIDSYSSLSTQANRAQGSKLSLWGVLEHKRVTLACEHKVEVVKNVSYRALLNNPNLRRFTEKEAPSALNYREMLGVLSATDLSYETILWSPLLPGQMVTDDLTRNPPDVGHLASQYTLDGVFMGVDKSARGAVGSASGKELWVCGGIINGNYPSTLLSSNFDRRNYDTDYRLQLTTPPYFLRAYGVTPTYIPGTWRSYEL